MPSLIEGYNYDIFISYRQKDNKHDGWVTEFVNKLKGELESTFKEEISVYFDINPHDGLLETHDVDASLKDKLKCLVFVPIISRTYCDQRSFAWEHEFKAFIEMASNDQYGLKVKLPGGNVASRVLPVQIHELDTNDKKLVESELGGFLRGIEFIYKEPGVNRPLTPEDDENKNQNKTKYRNQINKVALAINEILKATFTGSGDLNSEIKTEFAKEDQRDEEDGPIRMKEHYKKHWYDVLPKRFSLTIAILIAFALIILFIWLKILKPSAIENIRTPGRRITLVVMPFRNMTNDTTLNVWQDGIQYSMISFLSNFPEDVMVRQSESVNNIFQDKHIDIASLSPSIERTISLSLNAKAFITGNMVKSGQVLRLNAQLIDSETGNIYRSLQQEGTSDNIIKHVDSLNVKVKNVLVISRLEKELSPDFIYIGSIKFPEALRYFKAGQNAFNERDFRTASRLYEKALSIDSTLVYASFQLVFSDCNQELYDKAKIQAVDIYKKREQLPESQKILANLAYALCFETPNEEIKYLRQALEIDDQLPSFHFAMGMAYFGLHQFDKGIPEYEKALEIYNKWGIKPAWTGVYSHLGPVYHLLGQYKKEKELYDKAEKEFPDNPDILYGRSVLALSEGDTLAVKIYIDKFISVCKVRSISDVNILKSTGDIYSDAGIPEKAEKYYREALMSDPGNPEMINSLAYFLIEKKMSINEGIELVNKALQMNPENYKYLHTKGWGLYKKGKYQEALEILQKSWNLRREKAIYNHEAFLHLEAAKKAVAGQK